MPYSLAREPRPARPPEARRDGAAVVAARGRRRSRAGASGDPFGVWKLWRFQTALRNVDRRSEPTGTWDAEFDARAPAPTACPTPGGKATIDKPFWQSIVTAPNLTRTPWDDPVPTEADLVEYLPTETTALSVDRPSVVVPLGHGDRRRAGPPPRLPGRAGRRRAGRRCSYRLVPKWHGKKSVDWLPGAVGWTAAVAALLQNGTNPALPAGWTTGPAPLRQRVSTGADVAAGAPQAVSFDVDLGTGIKTGTLAILVAVVHTTADAVALSDVPLRQLTLDRRHVAVRSVLLRWSGTEVGSLFACCPRTCRRSRSTTTSWSRRTSSSTTSNPEFRDRAPRIVEQGEAQGWLWEDRFYPLIVPGQRRRRASSARVSPDAATTSSRGATRT